jgi:small subunit ribosomal protein S6
LKVYESTFIIDARTVEQDVQNLIEKFTKIVKDNNGEVSKVDNLGKKKLAYKIENNLDGIYIYMELNADGNIIKELERNYRNTDTIIRYLTVEKEYIKPPKIRKKPEPKEVPAAEPVPQPAAQSESGS